MLFEFWDQELSVSFSSKDGNVVAMLNNSAELTPDLFRPCLSV